MAKPPSNASVLFNFESDSSTIKRGKDAGYKLVMEGVDQVCWETSDLSDQGCLATRKYAKSFEEFYIDLDNRKVVSHEIYITDQGTVEKLKFTVSDVKYKRKSNKLVYQIEPLNNSQVDMMIGIENKRRFNASVYSKDPTNWFPDWQNDGEDMELSNSDLSYAVIVNAQLNCANLSGADLSNSLIYRGDMSNVNLSKANLADAVFDEVDLFNANLRGANLSGVELTGVDISEADLTGASNANSSTFKYADSVNTICPDGSTTGDGYYEYFDGIPWFYSNKCSADQLIPLA